MNSRLTQLPAPDGSTQRLLDVQLPHGPVGMLLSRLERVHRCGRGWIARCPAHEDKTASLSVAAGDDGRTLLHCFAGCSSADVAHAIGLQLGDLFARRITANLSPAERSALREAGRVAEWRAALNVLGLEASVVACAAQITLGGKSLNLDDSDRLGLALRRIDDAREVLCAR